MDEVLEDDTMPEDPHADEFDDADEGADDQGGPITSLHGSEDTIWGPA